MWAASGKQVMVEYIMQLNNKPHGNQWLHDYGLHDEIAKSTGQSVLGIQAGHLLLSSTLLSLAPLMLGAGGCRLPHLNQPLRIQRT